jgi:predicted ATPase/DNA-binding SARP family transcriptional activator
MPAPAAPPGVHITYSRQFRRCTRPSCPTCGPGQPGHGPYWYAYWREDGRLRSHYFGKTRPEEAVDATARGAGTDVAPAPALRVRTLGGFEVWRGDRAIPAPAWSRRGAVALFTLLLSLPQQRAPREYLRELLWPEDDPAASARKMREALYHLRRALNAPGQAAPYVRADGDVVALVAAPDTPPGPPESWLDAAAFERAATLALAAEEAAPCRAALALYTGDYLPEHLYDEWTAARRETLRGLYVAVLLHLATLHERAGAAVEAMRCLRAVLEVDACHEAAARSLMRVQAATGQQTEALRTYRRLAAALERDLALAPDSQTQALYTTVQAERATASAARTNLPTPFTSFLGRRRELAALATVLCPDAESATGGPRLVTLTGAGGCGKSRLAVELGHHVARAFDDGVWLVELATVTEPALVASTLCRVLAVAEEAHRGALETLIAALRTRHLLLLLDNCEHLLDSCAHLAAGLLGACPHLRILATSRQPLEMLGETVWPLSPLPVRDPATLPPGEDVGASAAMQLFVERGRAVRPGFALTPANRRAVAEVCYRLDGLPLAIELAAARLATLTVDEVAARLDDRFALLSSGNRAALPRQQTLQATLDWSYGLLDAPAQRLLRRLSVFSGGWTEAAAEAVCGREEDRQGTVRETLSELVGKSLLIAGDEDQPRWRMLQTVGDYARAGLATCGEQGTLRAAHARYFLELAEQAAPQLSGREQAAWLARLETEHANLRAALRWAQDSDAPEVGLRLAGALARFWEIHGHLHEGRRWLEEMLAVAGAEHRLELAAIRATALHGAGLLAYRLGDHEQALARGAECLGLRRALGDTQGAAATLNNLGNVAIRQGDLARAAAYLEESLALQRECGDPARLTAILNNLGNVACMQGDYGRATELFAESLAVQREHGSAEVIAIALSNLGYVASLQGNYGRATALLDESLALRRELGDREGVAIALNNLGQVACEQGDLSRAAERQVESLELFRELGAVWGMMYCLQGIALVAQASEYLSDGRRRAARLFGALAARRATLGISLPPNEQDQIEHALAVLHAAMGDTAFDAAWADGRAMSLEQACSYALATASPLLPRND